MKKIKTTIAACTMLLVSCTKSVIDTQVDTPLALTTKNGTTVTKGTNVALETKFQTAELDSATLSIDMIPEMICYSYENNGSPKPCNINITFKCSLSRPINSYVRVEIERTVKIDAKEKVVEKEDGVNSGAKIIFNIAPGKTEFITSSTIINHNNRGVDDSEFKIVNVRLFNMVN